MQSNREIVTNSSGGQVMPTVSASEYRMAQNQKDTGGGDVLHRFRRAFNFELYANPKPDTIDALCARRCHDWIVYN